MKIAILGIRGIPANYGGFETCAEETSVRWGKKHEVYVFCRKNICRYTSNRYKDVNLIKIGSIANKYLDTISHTFFCVIFLLFTRKIQVVHLYNSINAVFIPILRLFGKKVAISVDGLEWKRMKWNGVAKKSIKISEYICAKAANKIIADSKVVQNYYYNKFRVNPVYIPYGADFESEPDVRILEKYSLEARKYILFVGRLVPEKGVHNLIQGFLNVNTYMPLVIIGDDYNETDYIKMLKSIANEKVKFLGFKYGKEYQTFNRYPYFYVTASMLEGTSPALVAAMGAGNCVLVNAIPENIETIGEAGLYFEENNIHDLIEKMNFLTKSPDLVRDYGIKAMTYAREKYNWDEIAKRYEEVFNEMVA